MDPFERLGNDVERAWRALDYDEARFPAIAAQCLRDAAPASRVRAHDVLTWVAEARSLPRQEDLEGRFGEPPITVFANDRLYVDVLFWVDGTTSVHQHAFSGAFAVLEGSSIHSRFAFREEGRWNEHLRWGALRALDVELLEPGDVRPIVSGPSMIHSVFHLERPTASIVVRTRHEPSSGPQLAYLKPNLAVHSFFTTPKIRRLEQAFRMLRAVESPRLEELAVAALREADAMETYRVLAASVHALTEERFTALLDVVAEARPELAARLEPAMHEVRREGVLIARRASVKTAEHRFFLALLLNAPGPQALLELVARRRPGSDPVDVVCGWLGELARPDESGALPLGLELDDVGLAVARAMMRGGGFEAVVARLAAEYDEADLEAQREALRAVHDALRDSWTLRALFTAEDDTPPATARAARAA